MLKKDIEFVDFDGNKQVETHYFHLSKADIAAMEIGAGAQGFEAKMQAIIETGDGEVIMKHFRDIIGRTVGKRSEDGKKFYKDEDIKRDFFASEAYSELFLEICTDAKKAAEFIKGVVPKDLGDKLDGRMDELQGRMVPQTELVELPQPEDNLASQSPADVQLQSVASIDPNTDSRPLYVRENRHATQTELSTMTPQEFQEAFNYKMANPHLS